VRKKRRDSTACPLDARADEDPSLPSGHATATDAVPVSYLPTAYLPPGSHEGGQGDGMTSTSPRPMLSSLSTLPSIVRPGSLCTPTGFDHGCARIERPLDDWDEKQDWIVFHSGRDIASIPAGKPRAELQFGAGNNINDNNKQESPTNGIPSTTCFNTARAHAVPTGQPACSVLTPQLTTPACAVHSSLNWKAAAAAAIAAWVGSPACNPPSLLSLPSSAPRPLRLDSTMFAAATPNKLTESPTLSCIANQEQNRAKEAIPATTVTSEVVTRSPPDLQP